MMYDIGNTCQLQGFASGVSGQGVYVSNPFDVITNNILYNIGYDDGVNHSSPGQAVWMYHCGVSNETVANNTIFRNGVGIQYSWSSGSGPYCQTGPNNMTIANNIVVDNLTWGIMEDDYGCRTGGTCATNYGPSNYYENNLVYGNAGGMYSGYGTGICPQVGDTKYNIITFHGHCATNSVVNVNPASGTIFINWQLNGSGDYHLKASSPAIDTGENNGGNLFLAATRDFFGGNRPVGTRVDIGYHEYGSAAGAWPWY
jgi:hypothetical protein